MSRRTRTHTRNAPNTHTHSHAPAGMVSLEPVDAVNDNAACPASAEYAPSKIKSATMPKLHQQIVGIDAHHIKICSPCKTMTWNMHAQACTRHALTAIPPAQLNEFYLRHKGDKFVGWEDKSTSPNDSLWSCKLNLTGGSVGDRRLPDLTFTTEAPTKRVAERAACELVCSHQVALSIVSGSGAEGSQCTNCISCYCCCRRLSVALGLTDILVVAGTH